MCRKHYLRYSEAPLVAADIGNPDSSIVDAPLTEAVGNQVKVLGWYHYEWAFSSRPLSAPNESRQPPDSARGGQVRTDLTRGSRFAPWARIPPTAEQARPESNSEPE
ncbi:hypothetical protein KZZ52_36105 [Dactylosporangium sp. AC04546]|uniref:hypothetical protein n=1 Tax=Dactylosporangium sp. AC04546 TaxID=2862460 RepID=UPI001EDE24F9|nr:hypothetical protein [Dactylosporangium sp. AC04546]WVK79392.1 hypothetical protein KZZ52_36105 [Dactylosporangium sp. AC04546]